MCPKLMSVVPAGDGVMGVRGVAGTEKVTFIYNILSLKNKT